MAIFCDPECWTFHRYAEIDRAISVRSQLPRWQLVTSNWWPHVQSVVISQDNASHLHFIFLCLCSMEGGPTSWAGNSARPRCWSGSVVPLESIWSKCIIIYRIPDLHVFEWCSSHGKDGWPVSTTVIQLWNDFHTFTVFFGAAPGEQQWRSCRSMIEGNVKVTSISKGVGILTSQPCCTMLWDRQWTGVVASSSCLGCGNLCSWVTRQGFQQVHDGWVSCKGPNDRQMCAFTQLKVKMCWI